MPNHKERKPDPTEDSSGPRAARKQRKQQAEIDSASPPRSPTVTSGRKSSTRHAESSTSKSLPRVSNEVSKKSKSKDPKKHFEDVEMQMQRKHVRVVDSLASKSRSKLEPHRSHCLVTPPVAQATLVPSSLDVSYRPDVEEEVPTVKARPVTENEDKSLYTTLGSLLNSVSGRLFCLALVFTLAAMIITGIVCASGVCSDDGDDRREESNVIASSITRAPVTNLDDVVSPTNPTEPAVILGTARPTVPPQYVSYTIPPMPTYAPDPTITAETINDSGSPSWDIGLMIDMFQFTPETTVMEPTETELADLAWQTENFFSNFLSNLFDQEVIFVITWAVAFEPIRFDAQATVTFPSGDFPTTLAEFTRLVNQEMYAADKDQYVQDYVHLVDSQLYQGVTSVFSIYIMYEWLPTPVPTSAGGDGF